MTITLPQEEKQPRDTAYWAEEASVFKVERAPTGALNLMLLRAEDPLYELGMRLHVIPFFEDRFWRRTLIRLMAHFNLYAPVQITATCIDRHMQWSQTGNIWQNAAIRSAIYRMLSPMRWIRGRFQR